MAKGLMAREAVKLKSEQDMLGMRRAGRVVGGLLEALAGQVKPGVSTGQLDAFAKDFIEKQGAIPTFLGYQGFPASICTSVNEQVVHGIPSEVILKEGDIIGVDVGATLDGWVGDAARTFAVGKVSEQAKRLLQVTQEALNLGIAQARSGHRLQDIGHAVQQHVEKNGFSVVRDFVGHGIGRELHEAPQIPNYGQAGVGIEIKAGMCFAIEPMVNAGAWQVRVLKDAWTVVSKDGSLSAHFEDTVAVTDGDPEILTRL